MAEGLDRDPLFVQGIKNVKGQAIVAGDNGGRPLFFRKPEQTFDGDLHLLRFLLFGSGEVAPITREVLRRAEPDRTRRPHIHAG